jgi:hypothetical protein
MEVIKFQQRSLRNAEHLEWINKVTAALQKHDPDRLDIRTRYDELISLKQAEETAISVELGSALTALKDAADAYRDRRHSALYHYVKAFTYDETEGEVFEAAVRIMRIIRQVGSPVNLGNQAETGLLIRLGNELKPYGADLELTGARKFLDKLMEANRRFVELDEQCRSDKTARPSGNTKPAREKVDAAYFRLLNIITTLADIRQNEDLYSPLVNDLNAIAATFDTLLAQRKGRKKGDKTE